MNRAVIRSTLLLLLLLPFNTFAQGTISDGGVSISVDNFADSYAWVSTTGIGVGDQVHSFGFWYRTEQDTQEYPVISLQAPDSQAYVGDLATLTYNDVGDRGLFSAQISINIQESMGDDPGIIYSLQMTPLDGALTVDVFFYTDPDMDDDAGDDSAYFNDMGSGEYGMVVSDETCMELFAINIVSDVQGYTFADNYQVMSYPEMRELLNDTSISNLDDSGLPYGPGDFTAAFQYVGDNAPITTWMGVMSFFESGDENRPPCGIPEFVPVPVLGRPALAILLVLMLGVGWHFRSRFI